MLREILFVFHRLSDLPSQNFLDGDCLKFFEGTLLFQEIIKRARLG